MYMLQHANSTGVRYGITFGSDVLIADAEMDKYQCTA